MTENSDNSSTPGNNGRVGDIEEADEVDDGNVVSSPNNVQSDEVATSQEPSASREEAANNENENGDTKGADEAATTMDDEADAASGIEEDKVGSKLKASEPPPTDSPEMDEEEKTEIEPADENEETRNVEGAVAATDDETDEPNADVVDLEDPNPENEKQQQPVFETGQSTATSEQSSGNLSKILIVFLLLLLSALVVGIVLVVVFRAADEVSDDESDTPSLSPTTAPTAQPTLAPSTSPTEPGTQTLTEYLVSFDISSRDALVTPGTPQFQALDWLENIDLFRSNFTIDPMEFNSDLVERYVMATLYFSLSGPEWNNQLDFLSSRHICEWLRFFTNGQRIGVICGPGEDRNQTVRALDLWQLNLNGTLPDEIQYLSDLEALLLAYNPGISGTFPSVLTSMTRLGWLEIQYNSLTGTLPENIGDLSQLTRLALSNNLLFGELPTSFFELTELQLLALDDNLLSAPMNSFGALTQLGALYLEDNGFYGAVSESLLEAWSESLVFLDLSDNDLAAQRLPANLFSLNQLEVLDLHGNSFFGSVPGVISSNQALSFLSLFDNQLSASIPDSMGILTNLEHLDLSRNKLTGSIPLSLFDLRNLENLFLGSNPFDIGTFPTQLFQLTSLRELSLKDANLVGPIPPPIANLQSLWLLDLDQNQLSGTIPAELATLTNLLNLLLNRNNLSGTIPAGFAALQDLGVVLLDKNNLVGDVSAAICRDDLTFASSDCGGAFPEVICTCCNVCCEDSDAECNNLDWQVNLDPVWEFRYQRGEFRFGQEPLLP